MKTLAATLLALFAATSSARFLQTNQGPTFAATNLCGACILGGNVACLQQTEHFQAAAFPIAGTSAGQSQCCQTAQACSYETLPAWSCSNAYQDRVYSKYVCQYNTLVCGTSDTVSLVGVTSNTTNVTVTGLTAGNTCFYKVAADCGGINFKPTGLVTKAEIEYVEFRTSKLNATVQAVTYANNTLNSNSSAKQLAPPTAGMPIRFQSFQNSSTTINRVYMQYQLTPNTTMGRSGRYNNLASTFDWKKWHSDDQTSTAVTYLEDATAVNCEARNTYISVTATIDFGATANQNNITIFFQKSDLTAFPTTPVKTSAHFLTMTIAAILGLFAFILF